MLDQELVDLTPGDVLSGTTAFKLHDTYGFPRELTEEILAERGLALDLEEFERMMDDQRERARRHYRGGDAAEMADVYRSLLSAVDPTVFTGYEELAGTGRVLTILREGEAVERADEGETVEVFLDISPFYAESGGQVGDSGTIVTATGAVTVQDTQFALPSMHGHRGVVTDGSVQVGQDVTTHVNPLRREHIRKNHTGTHVLHWALRKIVGDHVHQAGSLVAPDRLRFDFSHYTGVTPEEIRAVEQAANERVIENAVVTTLETSKQEAEGMGALAFFGDKYGDRVRVVRAGDYSTEFCGGTHVPSTGQIGPVIVVAEGSVAANTRRLEALTGTAAYERLSEMRREMEEAAAALHAQPGQLVVAASSLARRLEEQGERIERFEAQARSETSSELMEQVEKHGDFALLVARRDDLDGDGLRALAFQVRDRLGPGIGVLGSVSDGKGALIAFASDDLVADGTSAGEIIATAARTLGGGGSRDPKLAQAGGPQGDRIDDALEEARVTAQEALLGR
jgi:alanyl-tRNA synthetase